MIIQTHRTLCVEYSSPVRDCRRTLRVFPPKKRAGQRVLELDWHCDPIPDFSEKTEDDFGNLALALRHESIAREFRFEMTLVTQHLSTPIAGDTNLPPTGIGAFLSPSALCNFSDEVLAASRALQDQSVAEICDWTHRAIEYSPDATSFKTSASQSLQLKRGVCQDHAHLMIALCRAAKIPARYVAGYIKGEGAMHAWCEVLLKDQWRGFDPTHNREARDAYVFVACGRDARDCASHEGSFRGCASATLESSCVTRIETS